MANKKPKTPAHKAGVRKLVAIREEYYQIRTMKLLKDAALALATESTHFQCSEGYTCPKTVLLERINEHLRLR